MPAIDLNAETLPTFLSRAEKITDNSTREWGTMSPAQMFEHLTLSLKAGLGEIPFEDRSNAFFRVLRPVLFSGYIPMPKGSAKTAPEYVATTSAGCEEEKAKFIDAAKRFIAECDASPDFVRRHPLFGVMPAKAWQRGNGIHIDHHLRQFGA